MLVLVVTGVVDLAVYLALARLLRIAEVTGVLAPGHRAAAPLGRPRPGRPRARP